MPFFMTTFKGLADENSSQVGEDERLDKGNHYFDQVNENGKRNAQRRESPTRNRAHGPENKNQCNETEDDDMSSNHVGEKTHNQCEWFGEHTQQLNREHDENPDWCRNARKPEDMTPKMLVGAEKNHKKRNDAQYYRKGNIPGNIR